VTLKPYSPDQLDSLALRLLDLAAILRDMSHLCRDCNIMDFMLHDKKAQQWCDNLDRWVRKSHAELEMRAIDTKANRRVKKS